MAQKWLDRCVATHERCRKTISGETLDIFDEPRLPMRVIDVGLANGSQVPRLLETQGRKGKYAALSYCWGPPDRHPLRTMRDNLDAHLKCLKLESLIKTHQHAVAVTRAIGIKYLWIDSLCIVQDDPMDWERESAVMGFIYERAHLTIAASAIQDSGEGLFVKRSQPRPTVNLPYINSSGQQEGLFAVSGFRVDNGLFPQVQLSALSKRAWATQEWILSRRMIHYMESSMIWTCQEIQQTETGMPAPVFAMDEDWDGVIRMYTRRGITYPGDRLFALQGISNEMQKRRKDKYVYGMWTGDFPQQLYWMRADKLEKNTALPHVPSWSWAS
ncbi:HET-domain-containing protein, partial [Glonium stellatum]